MIGASLSEPHTSETFVLLTIHKKLWIKSENLPWYGEVNGVDYSISIFGCVMAHDTVDKRE